MKEGRTYNIALGHSLPHPCNNCGHMYYTERKAQYFLRSEKPVLSITRTVKHTPSCTSMPASNNTFLPLPSTWEHRYWCWCWAPFQTSFRYQYRVWWCWGRRGRTGRKRERSRDDTCPLVSRSTPRPTPGTPALSGGRGQGVGQRWPSWLPAA